jgi:DNA gyrase/topoisomerase IV subunit B
VFQFSVGLNGLGMKAVNALSKKFGVRKRQFAAVDLAGRSQARINRKN